LLQAKEIHALCKKVYVYWTILCPIALPFHPASSTPALYLFAMASASVFSLAMASTSVLSSTIASTDSWWVRHGLSGLSFVRMSHKVSKDMLSQHMLKQSKYFALVSKASNDATSLYLIVSGLVWLMCYNIICYNVSVHNVTYKYVDNDARHTFYMLYITSCQIISCCITSCCITSCYVASGCCHWWLLHYKMILYHTLCDIMKTSLSHLCYYCTVLYCHYWLMLYKYNVQNAFSLRNLSNWYVMIKQGHIYLI